MWNLALSLAYPFVPTLLTGNCKNSGVEGGGVGRGGGRFTGLIIDEESSGRFHGK